MDPADKSPTIVVEDTAESLDELSEYLDVLSSSARLRIVKFLEKKPRDARAISNEIETSYENTKKHLDKLNEHRGDKKRGRPRGPPPHKVSTRVWAVCPYSGRTGIHYPGISACSQTPGSRSSAARYPAGWQSEKHSSQEVARDTWPAANWSLAANVTTGRSSFSGPTGLRVGRNRSGVALRGLQTVDVRVCRARVPVLTPPYVRISRPHREKFILEKKGDGSMKTGWSTGGTVLNNATGGKKTCRQLSTMAISWNSQKVPGAHGCC